MLLERLSEALGVSGAEGEVRDILMEAVRPHVDELRVDNLGNLIAFKRARGAAGRPTRVMLAAHMDEIGFMITQIEKGGLLRFRLVGGIDPRLLPAKRVVIGPQRVAGVIGFKPTHLVSPEEEQRVLDADQLTIDIGATSKDAAAGQVQVGMTGTFATRFAALGPAAGGRLVKGKAFDDRAGCAALAAILEGDYPLEVVGVFTVQEEVGLRGARVAAYAVQPDVAFAFEGTICDDLPKEKDVSPVTRIGGGPAITIADRSFIAHRGLLRLLVDTAQRQGLPYQFKEPALGGTDAGAIHLSRAGVPAAVVAVPSRYIHGPVSVLSLDDLEHTVALARATLPRLAAWPELDV